MQMSTPLKITMAASTAYVTFLGKNMSSDVKHYFLEKIQDAEIISIDFCL